MRLTFLTPAGALLALAAVLPLAALAANELRARRARRALRLEGPGLHARVGTAGLVALVPLLLGLAAAQPVVQSTRTVRTRADAQIFYVFDTSGSMRAAKDRHAPTRLRRAVAAARRMHEALGDVPSGLATMTDRVLPNIFPTGNEELFTAALDQTIGVDRPPPKGFDETATTFASLDTFAGTNFFSPGVAHRLVVLFTDGETAPYFSGDLREALRGSPRTRFVIVRVGGGGERIFLGGRPDRGYLPDPTAARATRALAGVVGGRAYTERHLGGAIAAARKALGRGPLQGVGVGLRVIALAPWLALAALVPLAFLLWRRNIVA